MVLELSGVAVVSTVLLSEGCGLVVGSGLVPSLVAWVTGGGGGVTGRDCCCIDCCCIDGSGSVVPTYINESVYSINYQDIPLWEYKSV